MSLVSDLQAYLSAINCSLRVIKVSPVWLNISGDHKQKFYWGHKEILVPVYKNMSDAMKKHPDVDVLISFASLRSAFDSTMETMQYPQVNTPLILHWLQSAEQLEERA